MDELPGHVSTINANGQMTIPAAAHEELSISAGDSVMVSVVDGRIELDRLPMTLTALLSHRTDRKISLNNARLPVKSV